MKKQFYDYNVFELAAEMVANTETYYTPFDDLPKSTRYACQPLWLDNRVKTDSGYCKVYQKIFMPSDQETGAAWYGYSEVREHRLARSLSLLFMAEMAKEEEL